MVLLFLAYLGGAFYWLRTRQWIGVLPALLLVVLLFLRGRLESSLEAKPPAAPAGDPGKMQ